MLVSDFMVNSMLKNTDKGTSVECMKCLNKDARKKKKQGQILYIASRDDQITTSASLLDITHEFYGFSPNVIQTIN